MHLILLGGAMVQDGQARVLGLSARSHPLALLALLATAPSRALSRGKLVGMLWPEVPEKVARNRLTSCLYQVRSELGDVVVTQGADLRLDDSALSCDVCAFEAALHAEAYDRAIRLYAGPFLDGFQLRNSPGFDHWTDRERDRLGRGLHVAIEALACAAESRGDMPAAAEWWRRRADQDPYDSRVARRLIESLAASGSGAEALRVAREHGRLLEQEFGTRPDDGFRKLVEKLRSGTDAATDRGSVIVAPSGEELPVRSVAVLPFQNISGLDEAEPFTVGLHDDLLTELSRVPMLTVISRTSVLRYRDSTRPIREIAHDLGVGTIVEAGVQIADGRLRLNVQLIDARSDTHRWVERYDRDLSTRSIFEIQNELAEKIARSLRAELAPTESDREREPTTSLEAYRLHARGRRWLDQRTEEGMRRSMEYFERAVELDPDYALAWVGLADALSLLLDYRHEHADDVLPRAGRAVRRALELEPYLAEAYGALAAFRGAAGDRQAAEAALRRAIELQPSYAEAHNWLSWHCLVVGRAEEALESAMRAVALDPLSPEAVSNLALSHLVNGAPDKAVLEARHAHELQPEWSTPALYEALPLYHMGRYPEAIALLEGLDVEWAGSGAPLTLALASAAHGNESRARELLEGFDQEGDDFAAGLTHLALGETQRGLARLRTADCASYWPTLSLHHFYPQVLAPLRADPLYQRLLSGTLRG